MVSGDSPLAKPLKKVIRLGLKKRLLITKALGVRLGDALHVAFHEGRLTRGQMTDLLHERLEAPGASRELYGRLVEKTLGLSLKFPGRSK